MEIIWKKLSSNQVNFLCTSQVSPLAVCISPKVSLEGNMILQFHAPSGILMAEHFKNGNCRHLKQIFLGKVTNIEVNKMFSSKGNGLQTNSRKCNKLLFEPSFLCRISQFTASNFGHVSRMTVAPMSKASRIFSVRRATAKFTLLLSAFL